MKIDSPCYGCDKCPCKNHDGCPDYAEYKANIEAQKQEKLKKSVVKAYVHQSIVKQQRKMRYKR
jgi:hypothetical protein